jgi:excisionase family DNA binding protein
VVRDLPPDSGPHERLLTVRQVAARLGVSAALVYRLCETKELQSLRIGGALRFHEAALQSFLAALDLAAKR